MKSSASRREFIRRAGALSAFGVGAPMALNLAAITAASAQTVPNDYRALVCLFMYGGNDNHNTVVPYDEANYKLYKAARPSLAIERASLLPIQPASPWTGNRQMALHPSLGPLKQIFDDGKLAIAMNLGPLKREGTTYQDYLNGDVPPKLFSHNDQQAVWQSSLAEGAKDGWGGRMVDLLLAGTSDATFASISASGNALLMSGRNVVQYQVGPEGSVAIEPVFGSTASTQALKTLLTRTNTNLLAREHAVIAQRSIESDIKVRGALAQVPGRAFPATALGEQFKIVARMIEARQALGVKRQVFFVGMGGVDHHDGLMEEGTGQQALLQQVAEAMKAFYDVTEALGVANKVTTFTASDFGRSLASNGDGSDHGWGSHHFVMGGSVKSKVWVGRVPAVSLKTGENDEILNGGRLLPAISVEQHGATLASWMGVPNHQLDSVFPDFSANYSTRSLGFMRT